MSNFVFVPEHVTIDFVVSLSPQLQKLLERIVDRGDLMPRVVAATARLEAASNALAGVVAAHPDPDPTD